MMETNRSQISRSTSGFTITAILQPHSRGSTARPHRAFDTAAISRRPLSEDLLVDARARVDISHARDPMKRVGLDVFKRPRLRRAGTLHRLNDGVAALLRRQEFDRTRERLDVGQPPNAIRRIVKSYADTGVPHTIFPDLVRADDVFNRAPMKDPAKTPRALGRELRAIDLVVDGVNRP